MLKLIYYAAIDISLALQPLQLDHGCSTSTPLIVSLYRVNHLNSN